MTIGKLELKLFLDDSVVHKVASCYQKHFFVSFYRGSFKVSFDVQIGREQVHE
jgi:hypothetical protein